MSEQVEIVVARCRGVGLRKTHVLEQVLEQLLQSKRPLTASEIVESEPLSGKCDPATIYRLLTRLEEKAILRRLGLHDRAAHYTVRQPNCHDDYLICTDCGSIEQLEMACPVEALQAEIAERSGYQNLDHELEFFGTCPTCALAS